MDERIQLDIEVRDLGPHVSALLEIGGNGPMHVAGVLFMTKDEWEAFAERLNAKQRNNSLFVRTRYYRSPFDPRGAQQPVQHQTGPDGEVPA